MCIHVSAIVEEGSESESMETEVIRYGFHTESRMRENSTYGSMRGRAYPAGALRSTLHPIVLFACNASIYSKKYMGRIDYFNQFTGRISFGVMIKVSSSLEVLSLMVHR